MNGSEFGHKQFFVLLLCLGAFLGCKAEEYQYPLPVTHFKAKATDGQVELSWRNPNYENLNAVRVLRKTDTKPASPTDGTEMYYAAGSGYTDNSVENGKTYYYKAFVYDYDGNYSSGVSVKAEPLAKSPRPVQDFTAKVTDGVVTLTWTNPPINPDNPSTFYGVMIRKRVTQCPGRRNMGTSLYDGTESTLDDSDVTTGTSYCYEAYTYDTAGDYSTGVTVWAKP